MFKNTFQSGFLSILYSLGSKPLQIWDSQVSNGHIKRLTDEELQSAVLELASANVATTYISCPADPAATLGIKLPFLVMVVRTGPPLCFDCHTCATGANLPTSSASAHKTVWNIASYPAQRTRSPPLGMSWKTAQHARRTG